MALGPHPQRELTPMPRLGFTCPRLGMAAGADFFFTGNGAQPRANSRRCLASDSHVLRSAWPQARDASDHGYDDLARAHAFDDASQVVVGDVLAVLTHRDDRVVHQRHFVARQPELQRLASTGHSVTA